MKTIPLLGTGVAVLAALSLAPLASARVVGRLFALTQATVKIEVTGGPVIYIDPTGKLSGVANGTGEALIEVYELP